MTKAHSETAGLLTTGEVATRLGICLRTVQLWSNAGILRTLHTPGGHRRFTEEAVQAVRARMNSGHVYSTGERWTSPSLQAVFSDFYLLINPGRLELKATAAPVVSLGNVSHTLVEWDHPIDSIIYQDGLATVSAVFSVPGVEVTVKWAGSLDPKIKHGRIPVPDHELYISIRRIHVPVPEAPADTAG